MLRHPFRLAPAVPAALASTLALSLVAAPAAQAAPAAAGARGEVSPATRGGLVPAEAADAPAVHTVAAGDTVSAVAAAHGLRTADVLAWNGLDWSSMIHPGQVLVLSPAPAPAAAAAAEPAAVASAEASASAHTVVAGDTLWAIAERHGIGLPALLAANALSESSIIYPGQQLLLAAMVPAVAVAETGAAPLWADFDDEQAGHARTIIEVGRILGVPDRGIAIALATAMVESGMRNLDWGDRDSLGLFQQRPSHGWGSDDQVRDPVRAAAAFFGGPGDPNGSATIGLLDIDGWEDLGFGAAAQEVQISAHPDRYGRWEDQAYQWLGLYG